MVYVYVSVWDEKLKIRRFLFAGFFYVRSKVGSVFDDDDAKLLTPAGAAGGFDGATTRAMIQCNDSTMMATTMMLHQRCLTLKN